jgi:hypothetical protein
MLSSVVGLSMLLASRYADGQELRTLSTAPTPAATNSICGQRVPPTQFLPPTGSGPVVYLIAPCFERQGGRSRFAPETYLRDIQLKASRPSQGKWTPYDVAAEQAILQDFQRLSTNHPLADLTIEIRDYPFSNGVVGKLVIYDMIERN